MSRQTIWLLLLVTSLLIGIWLMFGKALPFEDRAGSIEPEQDNSVYNSEIRNPPSGMTKAIVPGTDVSSKPHAVQSQQSDYKRSVTEDRLYDTFRRGMISSQTVDRVLALRAFEVCEEYFTPKPSPNFTHLDQASWKYLTSARNRMHGECREFGTQDLNQILSAAKILKRDISTTSDSELVLFNGLPRDHSTAQVEKLRYLLRQQIENGGISRFEVYEPALGDWLEYVTSINPSGVSEVLSSSPGTIRLAVSITPCFAGFTCDSESRYATVLCAGTGLCDSDVIVAVTRNLANDAARNRVIAQAKHMADILSNKNLNALALQ